MKEQLLQEQKNQCAYCTGTINFDNMKVEHWCSRKKCDTNRDLDYSNLFAVCQGRFNSGVFFHCDTSKGEELIEINPTVEHHITNLSYTKITGKLISSNSQHQNEIDFILNLNIEPLKKN